MLKPKLTFLMLFSLSCFLLNDVYAQATWTLDPFGKEKKPEKYEEKKLGSEKTADKKFTTFRRFVQNNVTHYNFYFNANNKLNAVLERAKLAQKDDYSQLLSFYPYTLENTAAQQSELDSVIYKATAGILLHDLRSDWVDNMYLLIGKAYYLRKELDSAALTFQFINYNLFPRKKKEDDDRIVGSNDGTGVGALSIANKENRNIVQKAFTLPPSRNDALIWLARTFTEKQEYGEAAGLINILQNDRSLPARLKNDLAEVNAFWFYSQNHYDSAAYYLERAISNSDTKQDKSRWEFLLAQLYEITGQFDKASSFYAKASKHTVDPVMDIFARLNNAKMMRNTGNFKELDKSIANILQMAKKDKYDSYRDVIYNSAAQLSMQRPDTMNAIVYYKKSIRYRGNSPLFKNKSFLQLANIAYNQGRYKEAHSYYDSLQVSENDLGMKEGELQERKTILANLVEKIIAIEREDSLQRIAAMNPGERDAYIKKLVKKFRKEQGLKEEDNFSGNSIITFNNRNEPVDLFAANTKGEWYFYNTNLRSRGINEFKNKWGKRANIDNWRRKTASEAIINKNLSVGTDIDVTPIDPLKLNLPSGPVEYTFDALMANVPLTPEKLDTSNIVLAANMVALAKIFQDDLQDYEQAIATYLDFMQRFPGNKAEAEVYLGLYYCYTKTGNASRATFFKNFLATKYPGTNFNAMLSNPSALEPGKKNPEANSRYENIYNLFIEGRFAEALTSKKQTDSLYGKNYWTPQLLYIESMYYIRERNDSNAIVVLNNLQSLYPASPLKDKAATMIEVLKRRAEIETYLTNLQVTRAAEDTVIISDGKPVTIEKAAVNDPVVKTVETVQKPISVRDSAIKAPPSFVGGSFTIEPNKPHYVIMVLNKVDPVYVNEARNAFLRFNRESMATQSVVINKDAIDLEKALLVFTPFEDAITAIKYFDRIKKAASVEVSWLQPAKYSFLIISENNLQVLKINKDLEGYKKLLITNFGNKF